MLRMAEAKDLVSEIFDINAAGTTSFGVGSRGGYSGPSTSDIILNLRREAISLLKFGEENSGDSKGISRAKDNIEGFIRTLIALNHISDKLGSDLIDRLRKLEFDKRGRKSGS